VSGPAPGPAAEDPRPGDRPKLGAIAVVLRADKVLLVRRRNKPDAGLWGYPGGHVELGETVREAAARELLEETGVVAAPGAYLDALDRITRAGDGSVLFHYLLVAVLCDFREGQAVASDDAEEARWVAVGDVLSGALEMSRDVDTVLRLALAQMS
jgi:ADP-ribose pyrophosphatase YjhB (NUDIX family)